MSDVQRPKPAVLVICDGLGVAPAGAGNAVAKAKTPNLDKYIATYPTMTVKSSGSEVGLSWGEMGNSEVGHLAIGAGRVYYQTLPRINNAIETKEFFINPVFKKASEHIHEKGSTLHLIGLISDGGVHSLDAHAHALLQFAKQEKIKKVKIHVILDGRDALYNSGIDFVQTLEEKIKEFKRGEIVSISGRYYAMDRDHRWDRTQKAYKAMVDGEGEFAKDAMDAIKTSYQKEVYDEEFIPLVIGKPGKPKGKIEDGDAVIFFNFRPDRMRQITKAFTLEEFDGFEREKKDIFVASMTEYEKGLPLEVAFPPEFIDNCLAEVLSKNGLKQLHIAETEKYAHVTFFMNGRREDPFPGEERKIIPSPRVGSYDEKPEMSAPELTEEVLKSIEEDKFDAIIMNFANADMVGHTGKLEATIKGVEAVDKGLGKIVDAVLQKDGVVLVTADHGNAEEVLNVRTGEIDKEHATNPVPFIVIGKEYEGKSGPAGDPPNGDLSLMPPVGLLGDVAPTMLDILGIEKPEEMTGTNLLH